jgi:hypothetical protein
MFHMLVCFDLKPGVSLGEFKASLSSFSEHLCDADLAAGVGPLGQRQSDTPLDTDREREHQHFALMSFRDRAQADAAYQYLKRRKEPGDSLHRAVNSKAANPVFICWVDT